MVLASHFLFECTHSIAFLPFPVWPHTPPLHSLHSTPAQCVPSPPTSPTRLAPPPSSADLPNSAHIMSVWAPPSSSPGCSQVWRRIFLRVHWTMTHWRGPQWTMDLFIYQSPRMVPMFGDVLLEGTTLNGWFSSNSRDQSQLKCLCLHDSPMTGDTHSLLHISNKWYFIDWPQMEK